MRVFEDRFEAGEVLSQLVSPKYKLKKDIIVLAIPSGGVPVGIKIADAHQQGIPCYEQKYPKCKTSMMRV